MNKKEKDLPKNDAVVSISTIPEIVTSKWDALQDLDIKIKDSMDLAQKAKNAVVTASSKSAGFGHKKAAIESIQAATKELSKAQISVAEAQEESAKNQKKLTDISKYLFALGVSNISANRAVVRALKEKLNGGNEEPLSEVAQKEILCLIQQLKDQEDVMNKIVRLDKKGQQHNRDLRENKEAIQQQIVKNQEHDKKIAKQVLKDKKQDSLILEIKTMNTENNLLIKALEDRILYFNNKNKITNKLLIANIILTISLFFLTVLFFY